MNMQSLMSQAKKMQDDMMKIQKEIEEKEFKVEKNGIEVIINGKSELVKININDVSLLLDKEILEDIILLTINEALDQLKKTKEEKLGKFAGPLGGLF